MLFRSLVFNVGMINGTNKDGDEEKTRLKFQLKPFEQNDWTNIYEWYNFMIALSSVFIFIATFVIFIKFIKASGNVHYRQDALSSLKRLGASYIVILLAPLFIHFALLVNNTLTQAFYTMLPEGKTLTDKLDGLSILKNLGDGVSSPFAGVLILSAFAVLQVKLNVIFIIRAFNIIVFTVFTPFAATL